MGTFSVMWLIATMSDLINSTMVFFLGNKLLGKNKKKPIKWRNL